MSSQLNVDTIVDKAGSGGTNVKIGNTSVTVAEGGSATTTTVQGLVKCWSHFNGTGTVATTDSFNQSSLTDAGTGVYTIVMTNNMNVSFGFATNKGDDSRGVGEARPDSTTGIRIICRQADGTSAAVDDARVSGSASGDLA